MRRGATWKQGCGAWSEPWIFAQEMSREMTREINSLTKSLSNVQMEGEKILSWKLTKNILQTTKGWISTKQSGRSCRSRELSWKQELRWFNFRNTFYLAGKLHLDPRLILLDVFFNLHLISFQDVEETFKNSLSSLEDKVGPLMWIKNTSYTLSDLGSSSLTKALQRWKREWQTLFLLLKLPTSNFVWQT